MKVPPPLLFASALLFWAWQSGHWVPGIVAAAWLEWTSRTSLQWQLSATNINRIVDLTSLALIAVVLYGYSDGPLAQGVFAALLWSPLLLLALLSAQMLSGRQGLQRRTLFYSQRHSKDPAAKREIDLSFVYLAACLLAAGQGAGNPRGYYPGLALLTGWLIWWYRPRSDRIPVWVLLLSLAMGLGYLGQMGLRQVQLQMEEAAVNWLTEFFNRDTDPYRATTSLGDVGNLKLSDQIIYRLESQRPLSNPLLLRTASYDRYVDTTWFSRHRAFKDEVPDSSGDSWQWQESPVQTSASVRIAAYLKGKQSILPLPIGTWRLEDLPVSKLERNPLGAVRVGEGPGLVRYRAYYEQATTDDAPPAEADLLVPAPEQPALAELAVELKLKGLEPEQATQRIQDHFQQTFRYTLELPGRKAGQTALGHFLRKLRRGHCEYFASATALLLRQAGIPARYAVGYSVQEQSRGSNRYIVRNSHAHAWTLVWHDGHWWDVDTTPSIWHSFEADHRPFWQPLLDLFSELYFQFNLSRFDPESDALKPWLWGTLALLFLLLAYRLRVGQSFRRHRSSKSHPDKQVRTTPMGIIEQVFEQAGFPRNRWETYGFWLNRLSREPELTQPSRELGEIVRIHYRDRYRSGGLDKSERQRMQQLADDWLQRWGADRLRSLAQDRDQLR